MNATSRGSGGKTSNPSIRRPSADPQGPTDLQLVMDMGRRDAAAIRQLYGRLAPLIFSVARQITGIAEDAEKVLVDTFHQAWAHAHMYDPSRATVEGWMVNIVRSRAIDRVRSRQRWQKGNHKASETPGPGSRNSMFSRLPALFSVSQRSFSYPRKKVFG